MTKNQTFTLRIEDEKLELLKNKYHSLSLSKIITYLIDKELKNEKVSKELMLKKDLTTDKQLRKEYKLSYEQGYHLKNSLRHIIGITGIDLLFLKNINMLKVNNIINTAQKIYDNYPEDIQEAQKEGMDYLNSLRDPKNISNLLSREPFVLRWVLRKSQPEALNLFKDEDIREELDFQTKREEYEFLKEKKNKKKKGKWEA